MIARWLPELSLDHTSCSKFRAAVYGAGVTDLDTLTMIRDFPAFDAELAGRAPWGAKPNDVSTRQSSPIWHIPKVHTPILILHREKDERVRLSQGMSFYRGCLSMGKSARSWYTQESLISAPNEHM